MARGNKVIPGEKLSVIEEFECGTDTYQKDGEVRSLRVGEIVTNLTERIINIKPIKNMDRIPRLGDIIIGIVETTQANTANVRIELINNKSSQAGFTGMLQLGSERYSGRGGHRRDTVCKAGDLLRARVFSDLNTIIHLSMDKPNEGVIHTVCSQCGGNVARIHNKVKCIECGNLEARQLASDFDTIKHR